MAATRCLVLLFFSLSVAVNTEVDLQKRIIGGHQCERQYHIKLRAVVAGKSSSLCGGSLISDRWILTAAHCLKPGGIIFANVSMHQGAPQQEVQITAKPEIYSDNNNNNNNNTVRDHDIMLLQLPSTSEVPPIALPDCGNRPERVEIAGYGATTGQAHGKRKPGESPALHCADIEIVDCKELSDILQKEFPAAYQVKKYQHWFCGQTPGIDICRGDSGGGAVHNDKIYGVISFLGNPDFVCRAPAAFMDLCDPEYAAWIRKTIKAL
ncbi:kallikrein-11-like [Archocentrus centrarchus]|uniref:kallikrein-11-like n=1 Tax=Archocentrus centrarchus TaxID=63155 RepID=UPI0011E9E55D|nr:kallikrein-11-like [Archocentrus centrarchus]